jgi:hypothetical protein
MGGVLVELVQEPSPTAGSPTTRAAQT